MPFSKLGLSTPLSDATIELKYKRPTSIQEKAIPTALKGRDIIATASTGTGKTAAFILPILERLKDTKTVKAKRFRALIITPTRELAAQIEEHTQRLSQFTELVTLSVCGGEKLDTQKESLLAKVDILIATPGRLIDLIYQQAVRFDELEVLVLDEADRMLNMGFIDDIEKILSNLPEQRQNLIFSATMPNKIFDLAESFMDNPAEIDCTRDTKQSAINQWLVTVDKSSKSALLSHLIQENQWQQGLIFIRTKHGAAKLVSQLAKRGITAETIHSDRSQNNRTKILNDFKNGDIPFLVATDIAARGIDIEELPLVINYDLPFVIDDYIHRIGRTGRAGKSGEAVSLVSYDDFKHLCFIESRLNHVIERKEFDGFPVKKTVPISILNFKPKSVQNKPKNVRHREDQKIKTSSTESQHLEKHNTHIKDDTPKQSKNETTQPSTTANNNVNKERKSISPWGKSFQKK